eukprot:comp9360_c0_seq1/m.4427 comp9360_c0_seq1/g.4427  ORF comp9360_c0_seq1/g.4427 comp9360_c0_seq1/m.4427 type:complete len:172 (-) comp9360_c0_seq1:502-1017(-)
MPKKEDFADFEQTWDVPLLSTCVQVPKYWFFACFCGPCFAYRQRARLLDGDVKGRYVCCAGQVCGDKLDSCSKPAPELCLCLEVFCCFWCAIGASRSLIQQAYRIQNTWLENCMIWCACIVGWVRCILSFFIDIPGDLDWILDLIYCMFQACLQSQQERELDVRKPQDANV